MVHFGAATSKAKTLRLFFSIYSLLPKRTRIPKKEHMLAGCEKKVSINSQKCFIYFRPQEEMPTVIIKSHISFLHFTFSVIVPSFI